VHRRRRLAGPSPGDLIVAISQHRSPAPLD